MASRNFNSYFLQASRIVIAKKTTVTDTQYSVARCPATITVAVTAEAKTARAATTLKAAEPSPHSFPWQPSDLCCPWFSRCSAQATEPEDVSKWRDRRTHPPTEMRDMRRHISIKKFMRFRDIDLRLKIELTFFLTPVFTFFSFCLDLYNCMNLMNDQHIIHVSWCLSNCQIKK